MHSISKGVQIAIILFGVSSLLIGCNKTEQTETKPAATVDPNVPAGSDAAQMSMPSKKDFNSGKD